MYKTLHGYMLLLFLGNIPRMAASYGTCMLNYLRYCQPVFWSGCTILYSHQKCRRVPVVPFLHQHLVWTKLFNFRHSDRYFIAVLICISSMTSDVYNLLKCLFAICVTAKVFIQILGQNFSNWVVFLFWDTDLS